VAVRGIAVVTGSGGFLANKRNAIEQELNLDFAEAWYATDLIEGHVGHERPASQARRRSSATDKLTFKVLATRASDVESSDTHLTR